MRCGRRRMRSKFKSASFPMRIGAGTFIRRQVKSNYDFASFSSWRCGLSPGHDARDSRRLTTGDTMNSKKTLIALSAALVLGALGAVSTAQAADSGEYDGEFVMPGSMDGVNPAYHPDLFPNYAKGGNGRDAYEAQWFTREGCGADLGGNGVGVHAFRDARRSRHQYSGRPQRQTRFDWPDRKRNRNQSSACA